MRMIIPLVLEAMKRYGIESVVESPVDAITGDLDVSYKPYPNTPFEELRKRNCGSMFNPTFKELKDEVKG